MRGRRMQSQGKADSGDGRQLPTAYLLMRREALLLELRFIEAELLARRVIKRPLVAKARRRDG